MLREHIFTGELPCERAVLTFSKVYSTAQVTGESTEILSRDQEIELTSSLKV